MYLELMANPNRLELAKKTTDENKNDDKALIAETNCHLIATRGLPR
jgi:hypothetical protein